MKYIVKRGCSFFIDFQKKVEGDIVGPLTAAQLKKVMRLVEPLVEDAPAAPAPAPEPPATPAGRAVEGDDSPAPTPTPRRKRRSEAPSDG